MAVWVVQTAPMRMDGDLFSGWEEPLPRRIAGLLLPWLVCGALMHIAAGRGRNTIAVCCAVAWTPLLLQVAFVEVLGALLLLPLVIPELFIVPFFALIFLGFVVWMSSWARRMT